MAVRLRLFTDPACVWSWASEPTVRALLQEFAGAVEWTFSMGGMKRDFTAPGPVHEWLDASARSRMPVDPRLWRDGPMTSSYPSCLAFKAAAAQAHDGGLAYLRALREGIFCEGAKLDTTEALVAVAQGVVPDVPRFRIDLGSHGTVEELAHDIDALRAIAEPQAIADGPGSVPDSHPAALLPTYLIEAESGIRTVARGLQSAEDLRRQLVVAGARPSTAARPEVRAALAAQGRMAGAEVAAVCDLPLAHAEGELARLELELRVRSVPVLAGRLWEPAA